MWHPAGFQTKGVASPMSKVMTNIIRFEIPDVAPSLNTWYMGGKAVIWKRKKDKDRWRKYVDEAIDKYGLGSIPSACYPIKVRITSCFTDKRIRDCDNWITGAKLAIDGLKEFGIIVDDDIRYISSVETIVLGQQPEKKTIVELIQ